MSESSSESRGFPPEVQVRLVLDSSTMVPARRRTILIGLAVIALGAATTIGIAWGASLQSAQRMTYSDSTWRSRDRVPGEGHGFIHAYLTSTFGWRMTSAATLTADRYSDATTAMAPEQVLSERELAMVMPWLSGSRPWPTYGYEIFCVHEFGWPLRCLYARSINVGDSIEYKRLWKLPGVRFFSLRGRDELPGLPKGIIGAEFAWDVAVWSGVWWVIVWVPGRLRSWWRRRGARCVACAYDLRGLPTNSPCPECGRATPNSPPISSQHTIPP